MCLSKHIVRHSTPSFFLVRLQIEVALTLHIVDEAFVNFEEI